MNTRTVTAFQALLTSLNDDPERTKLLESLRSVVDAEIMLHAERPRAPRLRHDLFESTAFRAVLERAWAADPRRTEHDLLTAGARDMAAVLGSWWDAEQYRARQMNRDAPAPATPGLG